MHALAFATGQGQITASGQMGGIRRGQRLGDDFPIALLAAGMRQATHGHHLLDAKGEAQGRTLRQHGQAARPLAPRPGGQVTSVQQHPPVRRQQFAAERAEQGALAGPVGAEHTEHLAGLQGQVDIRQHRAGTTADRQLLGTQHQKRSRSNR
ncbi:hypothetical protein D3C75_1034680 [compost metagenome]